MTDDELSSIEHYERRMVEFLERARESGKPVAVTSPRSENVGGFRLIRGANDGQTWRPHAIRLIEEIHRLRADLVTFGGARAYEEELLRDIRILIAQPEKWESHPVRRAAERYDLELTTGHLNHMARWLALKEWGEPHDQAIPSARYVDGLERWLVDMRFIWATLEGEPWAVVVFDRERKRIVTFLPRDDVPKPLRMK